MENDHRNIDTMSKRRKVDAPRESKLGYDWKHTAVVELLSDSEGECLGRESPQAAQERMDEKLARRIAKREQRRLSSAVTSSSAAREPGTSSSAVTSSTVVDGDPGTSSSAVTWSSAAGEPGTASSAETSSSAAGEPGSSSSAAIFDDEALAQTLQLQEQEQDRTDTGFWRGMRWWKMGFWRSTRDSIDRRKQAMEDGILARSMQLAQERELADHRNALAERQCGSIRHLDELEKCQRLALRHVRHKAGGLHAAAVGLLEKRVISLGYTAGDCANVLAYVRDDAPVIIHVQESKLPLLVADPNYRNQFETGTSGGTLGGNRKKWEDTIFGGHYSAAQPHERPKYGCLNMTGDYCGVAKAYQYGHLFMILKADVRIRTTFTDSDSAYSDGTDVATGEFYAHVFMRYSDAELQTVLQVSESAESRIRGCKSNSFALYKEAQIHGPVSMRKDVLALSVPGKEAQAAALLRRHVAAFQKLSGCNVIWQGDCFE